jgi:hypothetical protein
MRWLNCGVNFFYDCNRTREIIVALDVGGLGQHEQEYGRNPDGRSRFGIGGLYVISFSGLMLHSKRSN